MISLLQETKLVFKKVYTKRPLLHCFGFVIIPGVLFYLAAFFLMRSFGYSTMEIIRDPAQINESSSLFGFISNVGNAVWVSSASIAIFTASTANAEFSSRRKELLILAGILSLLLAVDDFFMLHDRYISQNACYATHAIFAITILLRHYRLILENYATSFFFAGTFLALSILTDMEQKHLPLTYDQTQVFEEGFKFAGGLVWLYFVGSVASKKPKPTT